MSRLTEKYITIEEETVSDFTITSFPEVKRVHWVATLEGLVDDLANVTVQRTGMTAGLALKNLREAVVSEGWTL